MSRTNRDGSADHTLRDLLRSGGRLSFERAAAVLADVAEALTPRHAAGQAHGALTPQAVHVNAAGRAHLGHPAGDPTAAGLLPPAYLAPERIAGAPADARSDVYALGLLGWEMLTGQTPWAGVSPQEVVLQQQVQDLPRLTTLRPGVPRSLLLAIEGALHKSPGDRWADAGELLATLRPARPARPIALGPISARREPVIPARAGSGTRRRSSGRRFAVVALLLTVLVAGGAALASLQGREKQQVTASWLDSITTTSDAGIVMVDDSTRDTAARVRGRSANAGAARATPAATADTVPPPAFAAPPGEAERPVEPPRTPNAAGADSVVPPARDSTAGEAAPAPPVVTPPPDRQIPVTPAPVAPAPVAPAPVAPAPVTPASDTARRPAAAPDSASRPDSSARPRR